MKEIIQISVLLLVLFFVIILGITGLVNIICVVPYVPTRKKIVKKMLEIAELKDHQNILDLGCGDGRFLIESAKKKDITATGYEIAPLPYLLAKFFTLINRKKITIKMQNFYKADVSQADTIFCYLLPETMDRLANKFQNECKKGTKIISHTFKTDKLNLVKMWPKDKENHLPAIYLYQI